MTRCRCNESRTPEHRCWATVEAEVKALREENARLLALLRMYHTMIWCPVCMADPDMTADVESIGPGASVVIPTGWVTKHEPACEVGRALAVPDEVRR